MPRKPPLLVDPVGPYEIADRMNLGRSTVYAWRHRGLLPPPAAVISGHAIWEWETIQAWAKQNGYPKPGPGSAAN